MQLYNTLIELKGAAEHDFYKDKKSDSYSAKKNAASKERISEKVP